LLSLSVDGMVVEDSFGGGDWQAFDLDENMEKDEGDHINTSSISEIEVARDADSQVIPPLDDSSIMEPADDSKLTLENKQKEDEELTFNEDTNGIDTFDIGDAPDQEQLPDELNTSDLNATTTSIPSRMSIEFALANEDVKSEETKTTTRPKKKRKIGRDSVTELNSAFMKKVSIC
jgi:hypothetical protein